MLSPAAHLLPSSRSLTLLPSRPFSIAVLLSVVVSVGCTSVKVSSSIPCSGHQIWTSTKNCCHQDLIPAHTFRQLIPPRHTSHPKATPLASLQFIYLANDSYLSLNVYRANGLEATKKSLTSPDLWQLHPTITPVTARDNSGTYCNVAGSQSLEPRIRTRGRF